jgi:hypothetical protein
MARAVILFSDKRVLMFAFTADDHWVLGIGDPTVVGWITVFAYFVAAWLCWQARNKAVPEDSQGQGLRRFWSFYSVVLVLLGINKQLDLQTWFTLFAKHLALDEGWYRQRRVFQAAFIGTVALGGAAGLLGMRALAGRTTGPIRTALIGGIFLGCFILIRASSFHHVDRMLGLSFGGVKVNWMLELGSISCIAAAALMALRTRSTKTACQQSFVWVSAGDRLRKPSP